MKLLEQMTDPGWYIVSNAPAQKCMPLRWSDPDDPDNPPNYSVVEDINEQWKSHDQHYLVYVPINSRSTG